MTRTSTVNLWLLAASLGLSALGCQSGGVGDPCIPEDEYHQTFNGYAPTEVNVESKSFQCETRVCVVNHFQGRVSCPYGQAAANSPDTVTPGTATYKPPTDPARCRIPGTDGKHCVDGNMKPVACSDGTGPGLTNIDEISVPVESQLIYRNAQDTVYCSCRCKGPDTTAKYCECPSGYVCSELVRELGLGPSQLAGSYCLKSGTVYDPLAALKPDTCYDDGVNKQIKETADSRYNIAQVCGSPAGSNPPYSKQQ
jgi:hypothetical protein